MTSFNVDNFDSWKPQDFPVGVTCPEAGNSRLYLTGGWRSMRPVWDPDKCKNCMMCWVYCPDSCIQVEDKKMIGIDMDHCKGCGVCVTECPFDALSYVSEASAQEDEDE